MEARTSSREAPKGVVWVEDTFDLVPRWTVEPDPEAVKAAIRAFFDFHRRKAFTYRTLPRVRSTGCTPSDLMTILMSLSCASLPIDDPAIKTLSEVATVEWVRLNTSLPVPRILFFEENREARLGFEWILMTKVPGTTLADAWGSMDFPAKKRLVQRLAIFSSSLFNKQLRGIGNIYPSSKSLYKNLDGPDSDQPAVQRIVSADFYWGDRPWNPPGNSVSRDPFRSSKAWLEARLSVEEHDYHCTVRHCAEKEDLTKQDRSQVKRVVAVLRVIRRLKALINSDLDHFPTCSKQNEAEPSMLCHDDLSWMNILVDEAGALTGVIDWECVSALPLWKACDYPAYMKTQTNHVEPDEAKYRHDEDSRRFYLKRRRTYELTKLRQYFLDEMRRLEPGWVEVFVASEWLRDLEFVIQQCHFVHTRKLIDRWIDGVIGKSEPFSYYKRVLG